MSDVVVVLASAAEGVIAVFGPFSAYGHEADRFMGTLDLRGGRSAKIVDLSYTAEEEEDDL